METLMIKAGSLVAPATARCNETLSERLSLNQTACALVALLNGAEQIPAVGQLRSMVRRGLRARRIAANGGRRHG
jgi:hypothetical protein